MNDPDEIRRRVLEAIYDHDHAPEEEKDASRRRLNEALDEAARAAPGNVSREAVRDFFYGEMYRDYRRSRNRRGKA